MLVNKVKRNARISRFFRINKQQDVCLVTDTGLVFAVRNERVCRQHCRAAGCSYKRMGRGDHEEEMKALRKAVKLAEKKETIVEQSKIKEDHDNAEDNDN